MKSIIGKGFEITISIVHNLRALFVSTRARFSCISLIVHETGLDFEHDFEPWEGKTCLVEIPVKVMKMSMIDMTRIMRVPKHLIEEEIKKHVAT